MGCGWWDGGSGQLWAGLMGRWGVGVWGLGWGVGLGGRGGGVGSVGWGGGGKDEGVYGPVYSIGCAPSYPLPNLSPITQHLSTFSLSSNAFNT